MTLSIYDEVMERAAELRRIETGESNWQWVQGSPTSGYMCAVDGGPHLGMERKTVNAINKWMARTQQFEDENLAVDIINYNDFIAKTPLDVAVLLEKFAAELQ